jgi:hypothetical protein
MISSVGVVPPLLLPLPDQYGAPVTVTAVADPDAVEVTVPPDESQTLPDSTQLPLATILTPHAATARYLPAGELLAGDLGVTWPGVVGPFGQDAWVIDALGEKSPLAPLLPAAVPAPAYWVLEGVDPASVGDPGGLLDSWLTGGAPGVHPRAKECHRSTDPGQQAGSENDTWKQRMLAGTWAEPVAAETALGLAASDGTQRLLRIWTFGADGTPLPTAAVLAAFATVDPALLPAHPVVAGCAGPAGNLPVRFYLRFDLWDVEQTSAEDQKGGARSLQPAAIRLIDGSGGEIENATWTLVSESTGIVLEVPRANVQGRAFSIQAEFPADQPIRLSRTENRTRPAGPPLVWSLAGWTAQDGTPGDWAAFDGFLVGTQTQPAAFWVGAKVRLAVAYQQQRRDEPGVHRSGRILSTRRVTATHVVNLVQDGLGVVDHFLTDDDGEASGVSFDVRPGRAMHAELPLELDLPSAAKGGNATTLVVTDEPPKTLLPRSYFDSTTSRFPAPFTALASGVVGSTQGLGLITIDSAKQDNSQRNTAYAAACHALKYTRLTHDATVALKGDSRDMPKRHEIILSLTGCSSHWANTVTGASTVYSFSDASSYTCLPAAKAWFTPLTICHEYGHALTYWIGGVLSSRLLANRYADASQSANDRLQAANGSTSHRAGLVTNSGSALDEGLAEFFECLMGAYPTFSNTETQLEKRDKPAKPAALEEQTWQKYAYTVVRQAAGASPQRVNLADDMGRRVEGAVAMALCGYLFDATGFNGFPVEAGDTQFGCRPAQAYLDDWTNSLPPGLQGTEPVRLQRLFRWLITDAIAVLYAGLINNWTGSWPSLSGKLIPYPTVHDYLSQLQVSDPVKSGMSSSPEESFGFLFTACLVPWNLEPYDPFEPNPPALDPDWLPGTDKSGNQLP